MILLKRITDGVASHFHVRVSEWAMVYPCLGMGIALNLQPDMFDASPSFAQLALWLEEREWAFFVIVCAAVRLFALTVNGTFASFRFSPHIRIAAACASAAFWFQFAWGFLQAHIEGEGALSAVIAYSTFVLLEAVNIWRSSEDVGRALRG
ncbi:hypothetical protein ATO8_00045 [Roseivivax marinus]|uniref:Transmembrane protein n=1 Tax=Roseivivax marinus TaxID=1379903 RepID=W4HNA6_9RHOB|nr:hypothetical protein [Roseivivax marinus]ETW14252.1 hypothetical protein ATO8_00045 [Roseivivax marinus]